MRISILPRLRQACRGNRWGPDVAALAGASPEQGPSAGIEALMGHLPTGTAGALQGQDSRLGLNCVYLSGILADDPQLDKDRNGNPVLLLKVAYPAPDTRDTRQSLEAALDEIEVPASVAERHNGELQLGEAIFITGQLSGGGGIVASEIRSGPPPDP